MSGEDWHLRTLRMLLIHHREGWDTAKASRTISTLTPKSLCEVTMANLGHQELILRKGTYQNDKCLSKSKFCKKAVGTEVPPVCGSFQGEGVWDLSHTSQIPKMCTITSQRGTGVGRSQGLRRHREINCDNYPCAFPGDGLCKSCLGTSRIKDRGMSTL